MRPIFLLSLPRSGSTLTQRVLGAHPSIATLPEPWILLPQVYATRERGVVAEYGHLTAARAIREFADRLPGGVADYRAEVRGLALRLYERAAGGAPYFLDKTPRYHLVIDELVDLFPEAKLVFLWRNPLAVAASIAETWVGGRWDLGRWHVDLYDGVANLVAGYERHGMRAHATRYEDLVANSPSAWSALFDYLELSFDERVLTSFVTVPAAGRMGDRVGSMAYKAIDASSVEKWKSVLRTPVRRAWARRYLAWIGERRLSVMGYDAADLLRELDTVSGGFTETPSDIGWAAYSWAARVGRERAAFLLRRRAI